MLRKKRLRAFWDFTLSHNRVDGEALRFSSRILDQVDGGTTGAGKLLRGVADFGKPCRILQSEGQDFLWLRNLCAVS
jgi:hypothetical protein